MTRFELEEWCKKFLEGIFENSKPMMRLMATALEEDWEPAQLMAESAKIDAKEYGDYKKELADFVEDFAKQLK